MKLYFRSIIWGATLLALLVSAAALWLHANPKEAAATDSDGVSGRAFAMATLVLAWVTARLLLGHRRLHERLDFQSTHDLRTGLPNRVLFEQLLSHALERAGREKNAVGLLSIDVDRFKAINESFGHRRADDLLCKVVERLKSDLRAADSLSRVGADEFMLILPGITGAETAVRVAHRILESLKSSFDVGGRELFVSASVGISLYPEDGADAATIQKHADQAMQRAKAEGRHRFRLFEESLNAAASQRLELENALRNALRENQFYLHYQPKVDRAGCIVGLEALLRWKHPTLGIVPPDQFIPIVEEIGFIIPVGTWVLHEACRQVRAWQNQGLASACVSVNVSALQFAQSDFVDIVGNALRETGLAGPSLELEITESLLMRDAATAAEKLRALRALGVTIALDDFGTGYSSLAYLQTLPIDTLKIDRSFVRDMHKGTVVIRAIMLLAHSLGMRVIAEGVETEQQWEYLLRIGCNGMQGYLFFRPASADQIPALLARSALPPERLLAKSA